MLFAIVDENQNNSTLLPPTTLSSPLSSPDEQEQNTTNECMEMIPADKAISPGEAGEILLNYMNQANGAKREEQVELGGSQIAIIDEEHIIERERQDSEGKTIKERIIKRYKGFKCPKRLVVIVCCLLFLAVLAIVGGLVYYTRKKYSSNKQEGPFIPSTQSTKFHYILVCPGPEVIVYLTQENQTVFLDGVTNVDGQPVPSLNYQPLIDGNSAKYIAPSRLIITRASIGKTFHIKVSLEDEGGLISECSYQVKVEGEISAKVLLRM